MEWIQEYQLFLFDFDGLLVNTEKLHFEAYRKMCAQRGVILNWSEAKYISIAMHSATGLKEHILGEFPILAENATWDELYAEKKQAYMELLHGDIELMKGAFALLEAIKKAGVKSCVVTHSPDEQIQLIRKKNPILNTINHWITREHYSNPKPSPECYLKAITLFAKPGDRVIGFEDSPRGFQALQEAPLDRVFISSIFDRSTPSKLTLKPFYYATSLEEFCKNKHVLTCHN